MLGVRGLGWGGWGRGGVEEVQVGVGGDGTEFKGFQVRGLGSERSNELGDWGRRSLGREVELKGLGSRWSEELGGWCRSGWSWGRRS